MKIVIGFILGVCVAAAIAQTTVPITPSFLLAGGFKPDGTAAMIQLDVNGLVICSPRSP